MYVCLADESYDHAAVSSLQLLVWNSTGLEFHEFGISLVWNSVDVEFCERGTPDQWNSRLIEFQTSGIPELWNSMLRLPMMMRVFECFTHILSRSIVHRAPHLVYPKNTSHDCVPHPSSMRPCSGRGNIEIMRMTKF